MLGHDLRPTRSFRRRDIPADAPVTRPLRRTAPTGSERLENGVSRSSQNAVRSTTRRGSLVDGHDVRSVLGVAVPVGEVLEGELQVPLVGFPDGVERDSEDGD